MRRLQLFEIGDQPWCPPAVRDALTDYLEFSMTVNNPYLRLLPRLQRALSRLDCRSIVDLCSGGGGPWLQLSSALAAHGYPVTVFLTDLHPNLPALRRVQAASGGAISFHSRPVDARNVPARLAGFRTMFAGLHHFAPAEARAILADAVEHGHGIAVFEATSRRLSAVLVMLITPLAVLLTTPLIRPFRWSRLVLTYLVPLVPLIVLFDGVVSCLRSYTPAELRGLVGGLDERGFAWEIGEERVARTPLRVVYLVGYPVGGNVPA